VAAVTETGATRLGRRRLRRPGLDTVVPIAAVSVLFVWLFTLSLLRWYALEGSYDLGYFRQGAWLISSGKEPFITLAGRHLMGDHAVFVFYPMAWATKVLPAVPTLLGIQAGALALGAVPLWVFSRRVANLGLGTATALLVAYGLYPALHNINLFDFHPEVVAVPALLGATLFAFTGRWALYGLCITVVLLSKEDLAIVVVGLGLLLLLQRHPRAGAATMGVAIVWFLIDVAVVIPHFAGGQFSQAGRFSQYGDSIGEAATFILRHPARVAVDYASTENVAVVVGLFAPLCFLSLLAPKWVLPGIPLQLVFLQSNVAAAHTIQAQYTVGILCFAFLAAAMALSSASSSGTNRTLVGAVLIASVVFFVQLSNASPNRRPWQWRTRDAMDGARLAANRLVPREAAVSSSIRMWPLLAERPDLYNFPMPFERYLHRPPDAVALSERQDKVRYVVIDTAAVQWSPDLEEARQRLLSPLGFREIFSREGIFVYSR
jgi:uncharacterized membrane protein